MLTLRGPTRVLYFPVKTLVSSVIILVTTGGITLLLFFLSLPDVEGIIDLVMCVRVSTAMIS